MRGFIDDIIAGHNVDEAVERFERANQMADRTARLNREGLLYASWLFLAISAASSSLPIRVSVGDASYSLPKPTSAES
jgi:hypothetical protein